MEGRSTPNQAHVGIARVPDARAPSCPKSFKPKNITYATIEYVDIGGMQKDREKNSASLVPLREADALAHAVRLFEDLAKSHEAGSLDAMRDIESVDIELILTDLEQCAKRIERVEKDLKKKKETILETGIAGGQQALPAGARSGDAAARTRIQAGRTQDAHGFMFLTQKPMLYVLNLGDEEAPEIDRVVEKYHLEKLATKPHTAVVPFCGKIEAELAELDDAEAAEMMRLRIEGIRTRPAD